MSATESERHVYEWSTMLGLDETPGHIRALAHLAGPDDLEQLRKRMIDMYYDAVISYDRRNGTDYLSRKITEVVEPPKPAGYREIDKSKGTCRACVHRRMNSELGGGSMAYCMLGDPVPVGMFTTCDSHQPKEETNA